jgi:hypothetical protein
MPVQLPPQVPNDVPIGLPGILHLSSITSNGMGLAVNASPGLSRYWLVKRILVLLFAALPTGGAQYLYSEWSIGYPQTVWDPSTSWGWELNKKAPYYMFDASIFYSPVFITAGYGMYYTGAEYTKDSEPIIRENQSIFATTVSINYSGYEAWVQYQEYGTVTDSIEYPGFNVP